MGKGNRTKLKKAQDKVNNPSKYAVKKKAPKWVAPVITVCVVLLLAVAITLISLYDSGFFKRQKAVAESEHYQVTRTMMDYMLKDVYHNYYSTYYYYISAGYLKLDTSKSLKAQYTSDESETTWFDYFKNQTEQKISQMLALCEGAYAEGITLSKEDKKAIDEQVASLKASFKETADGMGLTLEGYLNNTYGAGVRMKDIRKVIELSTLATNYSSILNDRYHDGTTSAEVDQYYAEHSEDYITADYYRYAFTVKQDAVSADDYENTEDYDAAVAVAREKYETDKAAANQQAAAIAENATDTESFSNLVKAYLESTHETLTEEVQTEIQTALDALELKKIGFGYDSEVDCWLFGYVYTPKEESEEETTDTAKEEPEKTDAAALYATKVIADSSKDSTGEYTVTVYMVSRIAGRDESITKTIYYAIFGEDGASTAQSLINEFSAASDKAYTTFEKLANDKSAQYVNERTNLSAGSLGYDELDAWIFADERKTGDLTVVAVDSYQVALYMVGNGEVAWYASIWETIAGNKLDDWLNTKEESLKLTFDENYINSINM